METPRQVPLSPEQIVAVQEGEGFAHLIDPNTQQIYFLSKPYSPSIEESYVREKLDEAQAAVDRGEVSDWNVDEIKGEVRQKLARKEAEPK